MVTRAKYSHFSKELDNSIFRSDNACLHTVSVSKKQEADVLESHLHVLYPTLWDTKESLTFDFRFNNPAMTYSKE